MATYADREPRADIAPAVLRNSSSGPWLRNWSNGVDLYLKGDDGFSLRENGQALPNPAWLSANVFRTERWRVTDSQRWTINFFLAGEQKPVFAHDDVWSLRMARQLLTYLAADWNPQGTDIWHLRRQLEDAVHAAWLEAADSEIARIGAGS